MAVIAPRKKSRQAPFRRVTVLGSTGSIGCCTVDLLKKNRSAYQVQALTANNNVRLLAEQAQELGAKLAVVANPEAYKSLSEALSGTGIEAAAGPKAVAEAAGRPADWVMSSIVGIAGLAPTLEAIKHGAIIALANKETLASAGEIVMAEVARHGACLLPVDSEHSAIFQVMDFERPNLIQRIVLTASGGPFLEKTLEEMEAATPEQAVAHPNWDMGAKISVDSATMMNKGLELIEAFHLFPVSEEQIQILVHPQSVVHGMIDYVDGSVLAQLGTTDMRIPISYAMTWPERMQTPAPRLRLEEAGRLTFLPPDERRFPALRLARQALQIGGGAPTILNAANEVAVECFLNGKIGYLDIARIVEQTLAACPSRPLSGLEDAYQVNAEARRVAASLISGA